MDAPNNGAANTLLKRPRLAQCGVATLLYLVLHCLIPEAFPLVHCISKQRPALYSLSPVDIAKLVPRRLALGTVFTALQQQQLLQPSRIAVVHSDMHRLTSSALIIVHNCLFQTRTLVAYF